MKFDEHINIVHNKGKRVSGWILRVFHTRLPSVMLTLLKQLVYPTLEYNSVLWDPANRDLVDLLESVQKNFLKKVECHDLPPYSDYWDHLNPTLEYH